MRGYGFTEVGGPDKQAVLDVPVPVAGPDELLVRVRAAGVNPGDWRLREGNLALSPGMTLLVNGAGGGVGVVTVQLARAASLTVVGTASPAKHDLIASYGAMAVAYGDGVLDRIRDAAPGGIDAIFDLVGGDSLRAVSTLAADPAQVLSVADKDLVKRLGGREIVRDRSSAVLRRLADLVENRALTPHVTEAFPVDRAGEALALVEEGHTRGKVVLRVS